MGDPRLPRRAVRDPEELFTPQSGLIPVVIGLAAPALGVIAADPEQIVQVVTQRFLPVWMYAIFAGALVSAILSTVDSTLLVASGLLSHNVIVPAFGITSQRTRVVLARAGVVAFGLVAWLLAHRAEGVFALVEEASAFGSAGAVVAVTFGLFTPWGGPRAAYLSLGGGVVFYVAGVVFGWPYPFLSSLAAALAGFAAGAARAERGERAPAVSEQ